MARLLPGALTVSLLGSIGVMRACRKRPPQPAAAADGNNVQVDELPLTSATAESSGSMEKGEASSSASRQLLALVKLCPCQELGAPLLRRSKWSRHHLAMEEHSQQGTPDVCPAFRQRCWHALLAFIVRGPSRRAGWSARSHPCGPAQGLEAATQRSALDLFAFCLHCAWAALQLSMELAVKSWERVATGMGGAYYGAHLCFS